MHLLRTLLLCLACLAAALSPARAASACPLEARMGLVHLSPAAHHHRASHTCPAPMTCCVPTAAHLATPAIVVVRVWRPQPRPIALRDGSHEDAARPRLLRPPRSA